MGCVMVPMRKLLIKLSMSSQEFTFLVGLCLISLMLMHLPPLNGTERAEENRDDFPDRRQGGGTHLVFLQEKQTTTAVSSLPAA